GHSAFCELNYTPELPNGSVETSKAVKIAESFEVSKQFWAYLVEKGLITKPEDFVRSIPHMSFVWGEDNVNFLKARFEALQKYPIYKGMEFTTSKETIKNWMPLVMEGRDEKQPIAASNMKIGTDGNFGEHSGGMFAWSARKQGVKMHFNHEVKSMRRSGLGNGKWKFKIKHLETGDKFRVYSKFVFIGAGGGSLHLLEKSGIPEGNGFGGFPVRGQWLKCTNPEV